MSYRVGLDYDEHKELVEAYRIRFRNGEIDENTFRRFLARQGFNATEIENEVSDNDVG